MFEVQAMKKLYYARKYDKCIKSIQKPDRKINRKTLGDMQYPRVLSHWSNVCIES